MQADIGRRTRMRGSLMHWYVTVINVFLGAAVLYLAVNRLRAQRKENQDRLTGEVGNDE